MQPTYRMPWTRCFVHGNCQGRPTDRGPAARRASPPWTTTPDRPHLRKRFVRSAAASPVKETRGRTSFPCQGEPQVCCGVSVASHLNHDGPPDARRPPNRGLGTHADGDGPSQTAPATLHSTTSFLTAAVLVYTAGAGITAAAGTRLALQLILTAGFGYASIANTTN